MNKVVLKPKADYNRRVDSWIRWCAVATLAFIIYNVAVAVFS